MRGAATGRKRRAWFMGASLQRTLTQPVEFSGVGLHSGQACTATVRPAEDNCGIVFRRLDLSASDCLVAARPENVATTNHGTALVNRAGVTVSTVEHLMAALALCGVDNAEIDIFGPEAPILDGSSAVFVAGLEDAGFETQSAPRAGFVIEEPLAVHEGGDRVIEVSPFEGRSVDVAIDFCDCMIGTQSLILDLDCPADRARLAKARTFCRLYEIEALRRMGLIRGGSLENSLVVDGDRILNDEALRPLSTRRAADRRGAGGEAGPRSQRAHGAGALRPARTGKRRPRRDFRHGLRLYPFAPFDAVPRVVLNIARRGVF